MCYEFIVVFDLCCCDQTTHIVWEYREVSNTHISLCESLEIVSCYQILTIPWRNMTPFVTLDRRAGNYFSSYYELLILFRTLYPLYMAVASTRTTYHFPPSISNWRALTLFSLILLRLELDSHELYKVSLKGDALKRSLRNHIIQLVITLQAKAKSFDDFSTYMYMNLKRFQSYKTVSFLKHFMKSIW